MSPAISVTRESWKDMLAAAVSIFENLEGKGFRRTARQFVQSAGSR
jgi:hypothetical protein